MKIVFVCTGNTCRSPMAAALFNKKAADTGIKAQGDSRGVSVYGGNPASCNAVKAMAEDGVDISAHCSKPLSLADIEDADLILTMTARHKAVVQAMAGGNAQDKIYTLYEYAAGQDRDVGDPFGGSIHVYIECKNELAQLVDALWDKLM